MRIGKARLTFLVSRYVWPWIEDYWIFIVSVIVGVILPFLWMYQIEEARWNAITTLWGGVIVAIMVAWFLERQSERVQRRAWLRANSRHVSPTVRGILDQAAETVGLVLGLPDETVRRMQRGSPGSVRRQAMREASERSIDITLRRSEDAMIHARSLVHNARALASRIEDHHVVVEWLVAQHGPVLDRLTELQGSVQAFLSSCRLVATFAQPAPLVEPGPDGILAVFTGTAGSGLRLCEACWDILEACGWDRMVRGLRKHGMEP
jgi:hypothetical protein